MRSERNPDGDGSTAGGELSSVEATRRDPALELVDLERRTHVEQIPLDDPVREDLPLGDTSVDFQLHLRQLARPVVDADAVDAGIEAPDLEPVDHHTVREALDHRVRKLVTRQTLRQVAG